MSAGFAPQRDIVMTSEQASEQLNITPQQVTRLIRRGKLRATRCNLKEWDVEQASVESYAKANRSAGHPLSPTPAQSKRFGTGTAQAEYERAYQREYKRRLRAGTVVTHAQKDAGAQVKAHNNQTSCGRRVDKEQINSGRKAVATCKRCGVSQKR